MPRAKPKDYIEEARKFYEYLNTNRLLSPTEKSNLRKIYIEQYQERVQDAEMSFSQVFLGLVHGSLLVKTEDLNQVLFKDIHGPAEQKISPKTKLSKKKLSPHIAVDQHMAIPKSFLDTLNGTSSQPETSSNAFQDTSQLPQGIQHQGKWYICNLCGVRSPTRKDLNKHIDGRKHRVQVLLTNLKSNKGELLRDKHNIVVTSNFDDTDRPGLIKVKVAERERVTVLITIANKDAASVVYLRNCDLLKRIRVFQLSDTLNVTKGQGAVAAIQPGNSYTIAIDVQAEHINNYLTTLAFEFSTQQKRQFHVVRDLHVVCHNSLVDELQPTSPYKRPPRVAINRQFVEVIDGVRPPTIGDTHLKYVVEVPQAPVPAVLRRILNHGLKKTEVTPDDKVDEILSYVLSDLNAGNHLAKFRTLLHIEEVQMEVDIRKYDMHGVTMRRTKSRNLLVLRVPGLAENRPSVLKGDALYVRLQNADQKPEGQEFCGYVHNVGLEEVELGFSRKLMDRFIDNMRCNVRFTFNRLPLRLQHRATLLAEEHSLSNLLFPNGTTACARGTIQPVDAPLVLYNKILNNEQQNAVRHIVSGTSRPAPYLVFGPPGTGKTITIVEAMKQVLHCIPTAHVLVCAPSNSAADLVTQRLLEHIQRHKVLRLHAFSRSWNTVPEELKEVSNYNKATGQYIYPSKEDLMKYQVISSTLVTAGRIASASFPPGHFSHVFIDESGHALEPEALIAISGILETDIISHDGGQVVLAGDPKQLGPVLRSPIAIKYGLGLSLLERYMNSCDVYARKSGTSYDEKLLTKLVCNYRSHPAILKYPNDMFYDGELQACANQLLRESLCQWSGLPKKGFPIVFHGIVGKDQREERSPSFFNPEEAALVMRYIQDLLEARGIKILPAEIGVISPYRKQVQKIQGILRKRNLQDIKVGSVEEFQGQERRIIIISTVRSSPEHLALDVEYKLGFLKNPKRFNVSVTRSKALLVVIGNPFVLSMDPTWKGFLQYCEDNGAYKGCDFTSSEEELDDMIRRFGVLRMEEPSGVSARTSHEDPEWRGEQ